MIRTTYFSALANSEAGVASDDLVYGVVRWPQDWVEELIDRNFDTLAPPESLIEKMKKVEEAVERDGYSNPTAIAWESAEFESQYLEHIHSSAAAQRCISRIRSEARSSVVWLACWEADEEYCHRRLLADVIMEDLGSSSGDLSSAIVSRTCPDCGKDRVVNADRVDEIIPRFTSNNPDAARVIDAGADFICTACYRGVDEI